MNEGINKTYEFDCSNGTSALYVHVGAFLLMLHNMYIPMPLMCCPLYLNQVMFPETKTPQAPKTFLLTLKTPQNLAI